MRTVEASAKTREEAIQDALSQLGVEMYEVDKIEIVDEGSRGIFGLGARPVRVKLVVENMPDTPQGREERPRRSNVRRSNRRGTDRDGGEKAPEARQEKAQRPEKDNREDRGGEDRGERRKRGGERREQNEEPKGERRERGDGRRGRRGRGGGGEGRRGERKPDRQEDRPDQRQEPRKPAAEAKPKADNAPEPREDLPTGTASDAEAVATITDDQGREAAGLLSEIISKMGIEASVEFIRIDDGTARLNVTSEDGAILIGRKGRNLSAMQYLINRLISQADTAENSERLVVDVEGYVDRRRASLEDMARSMADKARSSGRNMRLKPLSPQERRIIHLTLEDDEEVRTFSMGESLYRSVVISPKNARPPKQSGGGRGGRRRGGRGNRPRQEDDFDASAFGD